MLQLALLWKVLEVQKINIFFFLQLFPSGKSTDSFPLSFMRKMSIFSREVTDGTKLSSRWITAKALLSSAAKTIAN